MFAKVLGILLAIVLMITGLGVLCPSHMVGSEMDPYSTFGQGIAGMPKQDAPFNGSFVDSTSPSINQETRITFSVNPQKDMPASTIKLFIPPNVEVVNGNLEWYGDLNKGDHLSISIVIKITDEISHCIKVLATCELRGTSISRSYYLPVSVADESEQDSPVSVRATSLSNPLSKHSSAQATASPDTVTVTGRWLYIDENGNHKPMRNVQVDINDSSLDPDEILGSTYTDSNGYYSLSYNNADGNERRIYSRAFANNAAARTAALTPISIGANASPPRTTPTSEGASKVIYSARTDPEAVAVGTLDFGTTVPAAANEAWQAIDATLTAQSWVNSQVSWTRSQINIEWPSGDHPVYQWEYDDATGAITEQNMKLPNKDVMAWDSVTVYHEYAHAIMLEAYGTNHYNLPQVLPAYPHSVILETNQGTAFLEGWAEFLQCAVDNNPDNLEYGGYNIETNDWYNIQDSGDLDGDIIEGAVASILWDIFDTADDDGVSKGFIPIWTALINNRPKEIHEFWDAWANDWGPTQSLWQLYYSHGVNKDNTAPSNVSNLESTSHSPDTWSNNPTVEVSWAQVTDDLSGLDGYSTLWTQDKAQMPTSTEGISNISTTKWHLSDGIWFFNIRSRDLAGNWADSYTSIGPFLIDTSAPPIPIINSPSHSDEPIWFSDNAPSFIWTIPSDVSGIAGYSYTLDKSQTTIPDTTENTTTNSQSYTHVTDGTWYFHVRAIDIAGNWGSTGHFMVNIDTSTPSLPPIITSPTHRNEMAWYSSNSPSFTWTTPVDPSGTVGYSYVFDQSEATLPDTTVDTTANSQSFTDVANGVWYFHVTAIDGAGNWGTTDHYAVNIDASPPPIPSLILPLDGLFMRNATPALNWSDETDLSEITYRLQIANDSDFSSPEVDKADLTNSAYRTAYLTLVDATYHWRIMATDEADNKGNWSAVWSFTVDTTPPPIPTLIAPSSDKASADTSPSLQWTNVLDSSGVVYILHVDDNADFSSLETIEIALTESQYTPANSLSEEVYYWRVKAVDGLGNASDWSSIESFRIYKPFPWWIWIVIIGTVALIALSAYYFFVMRNHPDDTDSVDAETLTL